jgi:hypothetical protein
VQDADEIEAAKLTKLIVEIGLVERQWTNTFADAIDSYSLLALAISEAIIVAHRGGALRAESEGVVLDKLVRAERFPRTDYRVWLLIGLIFSLCAYSWLRMIMTLWRPFRFISSN